MFLCYNHDRALGVCGVTLEDAFEQAKSETGDGDIEDYSFYELGKEIKVEQKLVPVVVAAKSK